MFLRTKNGQEIKKNMYLFIFDLHVSYIQVKNQFLKM